MRPTHHPGPARRGLRHPPPPRAASPRPNRHGPLPGRLSHGGDLPRSGRQSGLRPVEPAGPVAEPPLGSVVRRLRRCSGHGLPLPGWPVRGPIQRGRGAAQSPGDPMAHRGANHLLHRTTRAPKGPGRAAGRHVAPPARRPTLGGRRRPGDRGSTGPDSRRRPHLVARSDLRRGAHGADPGRRCLLCPVATRRIVRCGPPGGHGLRNSGGG